MHGIVIDKPDHARINPDFPHYAGRQLMVRKAGGESVFVSLIEPFAGESFIRGRRALPVEPAVPGLNGPVAVEVQVATRVHGAPAGERTDVLFADNSGQTCTVPAAGMTVQGEFAAIQKTGGQIIRAVLVGGTRLAVDDFEIAPALGRYRAKIARIDYRTRELTLDKIVPASAFRGAFVEIGDERRWSNHEVAEVVERDGVSVLKIRKSLELKRTRAEHLTPIGDDRTRVKVPIASFAENGLWVANGNYSRLWRMEGEFLAQEFTLLGRATPDDFAGDKADLVSLEIGPGQEVVLAARVTLSRTSDGSCRVETNVPVRVKLPGKGWQDYTLGSRK